MNSKIKWLNDFAFMAFCGCGNYSSLKNYVKEQWIIWMRSISDWNILRQSGNNSH